MNECKCSECKFYTDASYGFYQGFYCDANQEQFHYPDRAACEQFKEKKETDA